MLWDPLIRSFTSATVGIQFSYVLSSRAIFKSIRLCFDQCLIVLILAFDMASNSDYRDSLIHLAEQLVQAGRVLPSEPGKLHSADLFACSAVPFAVSERFSKEECITMANQILAKAIAERHQVDVRTRPDGGSFGRASAPVGCWHALQKVFRSLAVSQTVEDDSLLQDWTPTPNILPPNFGAVNLFTMAELPDETARVRSLYLSGRKSFTFRSRAPC